MATLLETDFVGSTAIEPTSVGSIIVATDGTHDSDGAVCVGTQLAQRDHVGATMLSVVEPAAIDDMPSSALETQRLIQVAIDRRIGELAAQRSRTRPTSTSVHYVRVGRRVPEVVRFADHQHASLIVLGLGSHGVLARLFHRETALRVISASTTPVLAVPALARGLPRKVVVGIDFSNASERSARHAVDLIGSGGTVYLAHVMPRTTVRSPMPHSTAMPPDDVIHGRLENVRRRLADRPDIRVEAIVLHGDPADELIAFAEHRRIDAIAVGRIGAPTDDESAVGSVATRIVRSAHTWVLVTPARQVEPNGVTDVERPVSLEAEPEMVE